MFYEPSVTGTKLIYKTRQFFKKFTFQGHCNKVKGQTMLFVKLVCIVVINIVIKLGSLEQKLWIGKENI